MIKDMIVSVDSLTDSVNTEDPLNNFNQPLRIMARINGEGSPTKDILLNSNLISYNIYLV